VVITTPSAISCVSGPCPDAGEGAGGDPVRLTGGRSPWSAARAIKRRRPSASRRTAGSPATLAPRQPSSGGLGRRPRPWPRMVLLARDTRVRGRPAARDTGRLAGYLTLTRHFTAWRRVRGNGSTIGIHKGKDLPRRTLTGPWPPDCCLRAFPTRGERRGPHGGETAWADERSRSMAITAMRRPRPDRPGHARGAWGGAAVVTPRGNPLLMSASTRQLAAAAPAARRVPRDRRSPPVARARPLLSAWTHVHAPARRRVPDCAPALRHRPPCDGP